MVCLSPDARKSLVSSRGRELTALTYVLHGNWLIGFPSLITSPLRPKVCPSTLPGRKALVRGKKKGTLAVARQTPEGEMGLARLLAFLGLALVVLGMALAASARPAGAAKPTSPALGPPLPRLSADRPDDARGKAQIHALYVLPSDGADRALDTSGTLRNSVLSFENWLAGKAKGRFLRLDTFEGSLDVTFVRLARTDAEIAAFGAFMRDEIEAEIEAAGFTDENKIYAVYYDGTSTFSCGGGAWPPTLPGSVAALYLNGLPESPVPCASNQFAGPGGAPTYLEFAMLHEIMHTLGFVPTCAPNQWRAGHVSDDPDDLMWAGDSAWVPSGWSNVVLDSGNDDYYKSRIRGCLDFNRSRFLTRH
jgi:hypothetical protein